MKNKPKDIILTLDAGGTNLVFNAIDFNYNVVATDELSAQSQNVDDFIIKLKNGFNNIYQKTNNNARAISFCFPGPADYERGIIGDLENLPFFRGGIPLKNILEYEFKIPVFINNDGDLFALGEAMKGILPEINNSLKESGSSKQYRNLLGITLGTGTGGGIVINGKLLEGDNSAGAEINRSNNYLNADMSIEETLSIRGIMQLYCSESGMELSVCPEPEDIYEIGLGNMPGNREAAIRAWNTFGVVLGHTLANTITLIDGIVVIGGGLAGAHKLFLPKAIESMNSTFTRTNGKKYPRLEVTAYNLENKNGLSEFIKNEDVEINYPGINSSVLYSPKKKVGVGISKLGTSEAVAVGACNYAVQKLDIQD